MKLALIIVLILKFAISVNSDDDDGTLWGDPPFTKPPKNNENITNWDYKADREMLYVILNEESGETEITILNCKNKCKDVPKINSFEEGSDLTLKSQIIEDKTVYKLIIANQDYEVPSQRRYTFKIGFSSSVQEYSIDIQIKDIDDVSPTIMVEQAACSIPENVKGPSNCTYKVFDPDTVIENIAITSDQHLELFKFELDEGYNNSNGIARLHLIKELDFEQQQMYIFEIQADDHTNIPGTAQAIINVKDQSDEPPRWVKIFATESFEEHAINQKYEILAEDGDIQIKAPINYKINPDTCHENITITKQLNNSGLIEIGEIDRDYPELKDNTIKCTVIAYEETNATWQTPTNIIFIVQDINDNPPLITLSKTEISINEGEFTQLSDLFSINDIDQGENAQFDVTLIDSPHAKAFQIIPSNGYRSWNFSINVLDPTLIDYDDKDWRNFSLTIKSKDKGINPKSLEHTEKINVIVKNKNNKIPYFVSDVFQTSVDEIIGENFEIINILANDNDTDDWVTYTLTTGNDKFSLREETNKSVTILTKNNNTFDYEKQQQIFIQIKVNDNLDGQLHQISEQIIIDVHDINNKLPRITLPDKTPEIKEHSNSSEPLKQLITAEDVDTTADLKFTILWDESYGIRMGTKIDNKTIFENVFDIATSYLKDENNVELKGKAIGTLYVTDSIKLDYEQFEILYLKIQVEDKNQIINKPGIDSAYLAIIIKDINDHEPEFDLDVTLSEKIVNENIKIGSLIGSVLATDLDGPEFNDVQYNLKPVNDTKPGLIQINPKTGELRVSGNIDADINVKNNIPPTYELYYEITATDSELDNKINISITVNDLNDMSPELKTQLPEITYLKEDTYILEELIKIDAIDYDRESPHNLISYNLNGQYNQNLFKLFYINNEGTIFANSTFQWTSTDTENITVYLLLKDNEGDSEKPNELYLNFTLNIIDVNNNKPILPNENVVTLRSLSENEDENDNEGVVTTIIADDKDKPCTNATKINYKINKIIQIKDYEQIEVTEEILKIVSKEKPENENCVNYGEVVVNKHLKGFYGNFYMTITAENIGDEYLNTTKDYKFKINSFNYLAPEIVFPNNDGRIILNIKQKTNTVLKLVGGADLPDFEATDSQNNKFEMVFSEVPNKWNDIFKLQNLGKSKAQLQMTMELPDPNQRKYTLGIQAEHNGTGSAERNVKSTFTVHFIDETEQPHFETTEEMINITENVKIFCSDFSKAIDDKCIRSNCIYNIYYYLMSSTEKQNFEIINKENKLCIRRALDYETQKIHILQIIAINDEIPPANIPPNYTPLKITIQVEDENDEPPVFDLKTFNGGMTSNDEPDKIIVTLSATDIDTVDKGKLTYEIVENSLSTSHKSLENIETPFTLKKDKIYNNFKPKDDMQGYFLFEVLVFDSDRKHNDSAEVQIFIISETNRIPFTFNNDVNTVEAKSIQIAEIFSNELEYNCSIDSINKKVSDESGQAIDNQTEVKTHFINSVNNKPIDKSLIHEKTSNIEILSQLKLHFQAIGINLSGIEDINNDVPKQIDELLRTLLIVVSVVLGTLIIILFVAFILRTRTLQKRLDSMTTNIFGSTKSDLNRLGTTVPGTNKHAVEANPVWNENLTKENQYDTISEASGGSDLIGIEDNPEFDYNYPKVSN